MSCTRIPEMTTFDINPGGKFDSRYWKSLALLYLLSDLKVVKVEYLHDASLRPSHLILFPRRSRV
jgi:hypothetical protein